MWQTRYLSTFHFSYVDTSAIPDVVVHYCNDTQSDFDLDFTDLTSFEGNPLDGCQSPGFERFLTNSNQQSPRMERNPSQHEIRVKLITEEESRYEKGISRGSY